MKKESTILHIGKYVDPLSDFGFKLLFGSEPNKDLLIGFLNGMFEGKKIVTDLTFIQNEQQGPQSAFRKSIFDLICIDQFGTKFIIEVQRVYQHYFKDRAVYYTSTLIHEQGPKGKSKWDFMLMEVYLIALMDFSFEDSLPDTYLHRVHLVEEATGKIFYEKLGYIFVEIPKFKKPVKDLKTDLDRWLYVLKNMSNLQKIPVFLDKRIFQKLFTIAEVSKLTKEEYMKYEKSLMAKWDEYAVLTTAKKEGKMEGRLEGKLEEVKNLILKLGLSDSQAAEIAEVSMDFVKNVRSGLKK